ncbi:unnamed protein product [Cylicocyclus nassatus]|uniref:Major sperm protein n=1 Tax=Cylicocyclus nassatus TaxID=53992 RepID=A0AA36HAB5_CYLNA|nr:unnamed protein product [Cylicocyclus nassatus]
MVHLTTMVLPTGEDTPVPKQMVIRNTTKQDIVLKIKTDAPRGLQFEAEKIVVDSRKYVIVNMIFNEKELNSSTRGTASMIYVYARPVTKYNQECLRRWLTVENCETTAQLAFCIQLYLTNAEFSASKLILDLPGSASLIDPVPNAIEAPLDTDCVTSINIDADTNTGTVFDDKDYRSALRIQDENKSRCAVLAPIMDMIFPPAAQPTHV